MVLSLLIVVIAISTTFNAVTVALPKLFAERLADLDQQPGAARRHRRLRLRVRRDDAVHDRPAARPIIR